ncbi:MAG: S41 family peptidase [Candidatus Cloacimonetes bacterium]|nr:S41 family peptidase [Candidatus Cloacimonadota bacterium]
MKKFLFIMLSIATAFSCAINKENSFQEITKTEPPAIIKDYIHSFTPTEVEIREIDFDVETIKQTLIKEEALADLALLYYFINTAYAGKDYFENQGVNFASNYDRAKKSISDDTMTIDQLNESLSLLFEGVYDGHIALYYSDGDNNYGKVFQRHFSEYFADVLVEKAMGYVVLKSSYSGLSEGDIIAEYKNKQIFFPTLSPTGKEHYLLGLRSWVPVDSMVIGVLISKERGYEYTSMSVPLHKAKEPSVSENTKFTSKEIGTHTVVTSTTFASGGDDIKLVETEMYEAGISLAQKPYFIWNTAKHQGGEVSYLTSFYKGLNDKAYAEMYRATLYSPAFNNFVDSQIPAEYHYFFPDLNINSNLRKFVLRNDDELIGINNVPPSYEGSVYLLTSSNTVSCGELNVSFARQSLKNIIVIGTSTAGAGTFSTAWTYPLPYSGIQVCLPTDISIGITTESIGNSPDYWLDSDDTLSEVIKWLDNPDTYIAK